mgnify:FL=1
MPATLSRRSLALIVGCVSMLSALPLIASQDVLVRFDRSPAVDRNSLISMGIVLVAETNDSWLAIGDPTTIADAVAPLMLGPESIAEVSDGAAFALIGPRSDLGADELSVCGRQIASGDGWRLVLAESGFSAECLESPAWFFRRLDLSPLLPEREPPDRWAGWADKTVTLVPDPLVQEMVDAIDTNVALSHWQALSESSTWSTRHSESQGCLDATAYVHGIFSAFGLAAEYQHHTSGFADNVIGTLTGSVDPTEVYIAIGHLDDLPSSGPAPGADDNASGTAMVTAAAEVMSDYCFARTVKFIAVTGEEQGLHGSDHYADQAAALGENIQAVLNGDMIGWEGDNPAVEDLDIIYNSTSAWLSQAMVDAAAGYGTGMTINALDCPGMASSDHWPFWQNGFSALCGITDDEGLCGSGGNYPYYHQSSDTIANCGPGAPDFEAAAIRTYVATLAHLAQPIARIPGVPMGLTAQADGDNRIALSWLPQDPGVTVEVHRAAGGCTNPGPYYLVGQSSGSTFVDTAASGGVPYGYRLVATAAAACTSEVSTCIDASTTGACTEAPVFAGVEQVTNTAASTCLLTVDWQPPDQVWCGGPVSYNVYRSTTAGFVPSPVNRVASSLGTTSWSDSNVVSFEEYHYIVRAVDEANGSEDRNTVQGHAAPTGPAVIGTWTDDAGDTGSVKLIPSSPWSVLPGAGVSGAAYATGAYGSDTCAALTTANLLFDSSPQLSFQSKFDIENGWDKGELQVSTNGGGSWSRVAMTYPGSSAYNNDSCGLGEGSFFTGTQTNYAGFTADLSAWSGQSVQLRWLFSSDGYIEEDGWWVDDIAITNVAVPGTCSGADAVFIDGFESGDTSAWSQ